MRRYAEQVERLVLADRIVLWHGLTGRSADLAPEVAEEVERWTPGLPPPPDLAGVARRLERLHLLAEHPQPDPARLLPARSRLVLLFPEEPSLWLPMPAVRTPGGHAYASRALSPEELSLWRACNGARDVAAVARKAGVPVERALAFFAELTRPEVQAVQLRERPVRRRDLALERLVAPERPPAPRPSHQRGPGGETTLDRYHLEITDGERHFDEHETTVAHAFAVPHPALQGERYGERLHRVLEERGLLPTGDGAVLEIGPGDGELGEAWRARAAARGLPRGEHVRLDQSPELLRTQRQRQPGTREVLGNATELPFAAGSLGLVLCNEVLADLAAVPYEPEDPDPSPAAREVAERLARHRIAPLPGRALYNLGAWKLVEELARTLAPGGVAWLSEFGELDEAPRETLQLDHPEVSIHFGHLAAVARSCGLSCTVEPLADFLGMDLGATWLARHSYEALRARCRRDGLHLRARAWTPETLALPWAVEGLVWTPVSDEGPGPLVTRFQAVTLRR